MVKIIKFRGRNAAASKKQAMHFYYNNFESTFSRKIFLAKCRLQADGKTIHFYPDLLIDDEKGERKNKGSK